MIERVVQFGRHLDQVGILCQPAAHLARVGSPIFVMWNVGVNHRVGPFRVYVDLSRDLAGVGFTAFRFDSSGLGDSEVRREAVSDAEREDLDVRDALDLLTKRTGIDRFVLIGFCSSVDAAHRVSVKDPRVVGVVHLEGYAFRSAGYKRRLPLRLLSRERWRRVVQDPGRKVGELNRRVRGLPDIPSEQTVFRREYPAWPAFRRDLATLTARNAALLFVYSGGDTDFNHLGQFWEMFGAPDIDRSKVDASYYAAADHTFYGISSRQAVRRRVVRWACERFPRTAAPSTQPASAPRV